MVKYPICIPAIPVTPFSFSILINSPIHTNLLFSPVSSIIIPLARVDLPYANLIIAGLDFFVTFLVKRSLVIPPQPKQVPSQMYPVTLTLKELAQLIQEAANGKQILPKVTSYQEYQDIGPLGVDVDIPLFPDNLSVSIVVAAPIIPTDITKSTPDVSFGVPLFEIPGAPGALIIALGTLIAQFFVERAGLGTGGNPQ